VPRPRQWLRLVNQALTSGELEAVRRSALRGTPLGDGAWARRTAIRLGLESSLRPPRPPAKQPKKLEWPLLPLGRDSERFAEVADARALMGTAPVTKASGRSRVVVFRRGCWKFARRTLQLFADQSRRGCTWAQTFYEQHRARGHTHHEALRALTHKWLKIILAMRRTATPYSEDTYAASRRRRLSKAV